MSRSCSFCPLDAYTIMDSGALCDGHAEQLAHQFVEALGQTSGVAWNQSGVEVDWSVLVRFLAERENPLLSYRPPTESELAVIQKGFVTKNMRSL